MNADVARCLPLLLAVCLCAASARAQTKAVADTQQAGLLAAAAVPAEVAVVVPDARLQGKARMSVWGMSVYDARLWSGSTVSKNDNGWAKAPMALELQYLRSLKGAQIAERSLVEMRKQASIDKADAERWLQAMKTSFPDVDAGDRITGVSLPGQGARFFVNGKPSGDIAEAEFARLFFGIWLSPGTSEPAMRDALFGGAALSARP